MAQRPEQVLILEPNNELVFKGPFTQVITVHLNLRNPSDKPVCFKVKTTAPKRYCVRPNSGILLPSKSISVAVMLQPFNYDPQEKNKHKFMVQTMFATSENPDDVDTMWKDALPDKLMDSKLRCVFDMPKSTSSALSSNPSIGKYESQNSPVELAALKEENKRLKESELRLRKLAMSDSTRPLHIMSTMENGTKVPPIAYLIIAFLVGLAIGKMILS